MVYALLFARGALNLRELAVALVTSLLLLAIRRQSGTNTVAVIDGVKERLREVAARLPAGYRLRIVRDASEYIEASVATVQEHLVVGAFLAALRAARSRPNTAEEMHHA